MYGFGRGIACCTGVCMYASRGQPASHLWVRLPDQTPNACLDERKHFDPPSSSTPQSTLCRFWGAGRRRPLKIRLLGNMDFHIWLPGQGRIWNKYGNDEVIMARVPYVTWQIERVWSVFSSISREGVCMYHYRSVLCVRLWV